MSRQEMLTRRAFLAISAAATAALGTGTTQAAPPTEARIPPNLWTEARRMVDDGMLGKPYYVSIRADRTRTMDYARHIGRRINAVLQYGGWVYEPIGFVPELEGYPDHAMAILEFPLGLRCTLNATAHHGETDTYIIRGEGGSLHLTDGPTPRLEFQDEHDRPRICYNRLTRDLPQPH